MKVNKGFLLAVPAIAGLVIAAMRFCPGPGCRRRHGDRPESRRSPGRRAMEDVGAIRENTARILEILEDIAGKTRGKEPAGS